MLKRVDSALAVVSWAAAAVLVLMLFIGPQVVAEDKSKPAGPPPSGGGAAAEGRSVFRDNCGRCHTLQAAGTSGQVGPPLDEIAKSAGEIEGIVRAGRGIMPSFRGTLSDAQIRAVAAFVAHRR